MQRFERVQLCECSPNRYLISEAACVRCMLRAGAHQEKGRQALTIMMSIPLASSTEMPRLLSRFSGPSTVDTPGGTASPFLWSVASVFGQSDSEQPPQYR